jgi:hypothetical protein
MEKKRDFEGLQGLIPYVVHRGECKKGECKKGEGREIACILPLFRENVSESIERDLAGENA